MSSSVDLNVFGTDFGFWQNALRAVQGRKVGVVSVKEKVYDCEFEIELTKANSGCVMMRCSFCSSPFCKESKEITCAAIDARNVQSLVDEVGEINKFIS
ncbi:MAG: hypothetical protein LBF94_02155, partial [Puniceicoccales bacterium]|nr:hypothetical protein [Puniceicoccales bacterium]